MEVPYGNIINSVINLIVIAIFVYAFLNAEMKGRIIMTAILALLFILPAVFTASVIYWLCYAGKVIFGLSCYLYIKGKGASI
jgi:ABC-type sugar transport system permease subunit